MAEPKKRIVVDGIDLKGMFHFPVILRSVTAAMLPPRLIVALFMVVLLITGGRIWDAVAPKTVPPGGLLAPAMTAPEVAAAHRQLEAAAARYDVAFSNDPHEARAAITDRYRNQRQLDLQGRLINGEAGGSKPQEMIRANDAAFLATIQAFDAVTPRGAFDATSHAIVDSFSSGLQGILYLQPERTLNAAGNLFYRIPLAIWSTQRAFALVFGIFALLVIAIGGGALSRMAACELAGRERLRVRDAFDFALGNWLKLSLAVSLPLFIAGALALLMLLPGVLMMIPWLDVVGGVVYGVSIVLGFLIAIVLLGYAVGFPMLIPAIACENCDPADALQRSYAYVLNRPLHLVGYGATALLGLLIGYVVVGLVATVTLNVTAGLAGAFTSNSAVMNAGGFSLFNLAPDPSAPIHASVHASWTAGAIAFWQWLVIDLVIAYVASYLFTAFTSVYLLMRRACDGQDVVEIWRPGLTPGTLVPLPRTRVGEESHNVRSAETQSTAGQWKSNPHAQDNNDDDDDDDDLRGDGDDEGEGDGDRDANNDSPRGETRALSYEHSSA